MRKPNPRHQNEPSRCNSLEVMTEMYIFGPKSSHFEKSRPRIVSKITSLESPYAKTYS